MPHMRTADAVIESLIRHGIDTLYALPGVHTTTCSMPPIASRAGSACCIRGTSRPPPTWLSAPRW